MKPARSVLILQFLRHVEQGLIVGKGDPGSSGPEVLTELADALRAILAGTPPDEALEIERETGRPGESLELAWRIDALLRQNEKWVRIHLLINEWRCRYGLKPLSQERLKNLYREQLPAIKRARSLHRLGERIRKSSETR